MTRFSDATQALADIEQALEENPDIAFDGYQGVVENAKDAIDKRAMFLNALASRIEALKASEAKIAKHRAAVERAFAFFMASTLATVKAHPDWSWHGDIHKLRVVRNGGKQPLAWRPFCKPGKIDRVVPELYTSAFPAEWLDTRVVIVLKEGFEDAVRQGAAAGPVDLLPRGERLAIG